MIVNLFLLLLVGTYVAYSYQNVSLELNLLDSPAAYSSELNFSNSRVFTHDVNSNYVVEKVTQSGITVWKSSKPGHRLTNATLVFNDLGPRFIYLTVCIGENKSDLLYYLYTLYGWTNLNDVHPMNIVLDGELDNKKHTLPSYDRLFPAEEEHKNDKLEPVDLDIEIGPNDKFDYKFTYKDSKYTYYYKPRKGYYVKNVNEGKTVLWKVRDGQVLAYVNAEKINGKFVTTTVTYLDEDNVYVDLFTNSEKGWEFTSTTEPVPPSDQLPAELPPKDSYELSEAMKPVDRLTVFDVSNIPEPPTCRTCTYGLNGIVYNVVYTNSNANVRKVVDGSTLIYELPPDLKFDHACYYVKNNNTVFVDFMARETDKIVFKYFEKFGNKYKEIPKAEFNEKLNKLMEFPAIIDISDQKEGYNVVKHFKGKVQYSVYTPEEGFIVKSVVDGNQYVVLYETDIRILNVTVYYFNQQKSLISLFYINGSKFNYEYFTYFKEMSKWVRVPEHFYFNMLHKHVDEVPHKLPSLDIRTAEQNKNYANVQLFSYPSAYVFIPKPNVTLSSVLDAGRMVWTARYPNENCSYVWFQYENNLLYIISKDGSNIRSYRYEKSGDKWYILNEEEYNLRFNFLYSKLLVADIKQVPEQFFDVKESDNMFAFKPKSGYMVGRIRYGDKAIWIGSDKLKCTSFNVIYGSHDTYLYLELLDSEYNKHVRYYKTTNGDTFKWRACNSFFGDFDCRSTKSLTGGKFGVDIKKLMASEKDPKSLTTPEDFIYPEDKPTLTTPEDKSESLTTPEDFIYPEDKPTLTTPEDKSESLTTPEDFIYPEDKPTFTTPEDKSESLTTPEDFIYPEDKSESLTTPEDFIYPEDSEQDKYNTSEGNFVNKDGDYLVVTNVDGSRDQPTPTNLYSDTTQVINGITVKPNSTLHFSPGVLDEKQYSPSLDYVTGKKTSLESIGYEHRLPLTLEPHNPEKVTQFEQDRSNEKFFDAEDSLSDKTVQKNLSKLNGSGNKSEGNFEKSQNKENKKETPKSNQNVPKKSVYPKRRDTSGKPFLSNLISKFKKFTGAIGFQKSNNTDKSTRKANSLPPKYVSVPRSKPPGNKVKESGKKPKSLTTPEDFIYPEDKPESLTTPEDFIYPEDKPTLTTPEDKSESLTTPEDFIYPEDSKSESSDLSKSKSEQKSVSKSLTTPEDFDYNLYSNSVRKDFKESDSKGEKISPLQPHPNYTNPNEKQFVGFGTGFKTYANGLLYLQDLRSTDFGEFRDARPHGFNFVLFTPYPGLPIKELKDGFETVWTSSTDECLALSVFVDNGFPKMLELFVKCSSDVRRKYYELEGNNWREVTSNRYDAVTA